MPHLHLPTIAVVVILLLAGLSGCSSGDDDAAPSASSSAAVVTPEPEPEAEPDAAPTRVRVGSVAGRMPPPRRRALVRTITPVVDEWIDAKWTGGEWPREIDEAFPGFTRGATRAARRDRRIITATDLAGRVDAVAVSRRAVRLDVLAVDRRPVGVTARVALDVATSGSLERTVTVRGRLMLTRVRGEWKIFGYDLTQGKR